MPDSSNVLEQLRDQAYMSTASQDAVGINEHNAYQPNIFPMTAEQLSQGLSSISGSTEYYRDLGAIRNRSLPQTIADTGVSAIQGLESVGTIPAAVIGASQDLVNLGLNAAFDTNYDTSHTTRYLQGINNLIDATGETLQSNEMQRRRKAMAARSTAFSEENSRQLQEDLANGRNNLEAHLAYIGRGILNSASELDELPEILDVAGQAVGQIAGQSATINLARNMIRQGLDAAANGVKNAGIRQFINNQVGRDKAASATGSLVAPSRTDTALNMAAIGLTEAGGQAANTADIIDSIPTKDLYQQSPEFVSLVQENLAAGLDLPTAEIRARDSLKNSATLRSLAYSTPAALIASRAGSRLVDNPLGRAIPAIPNQAGRRLRNNVVDVLGETTEEASTGFGTGVASQLAAQQTYDANANLLEGAGENIGTGLTSGLYGASAIRSPSLVRDSVGAVVSPVASTVSTGARTTARVVSPVASAVGRTVSDTVKRGADAVNRAAVRREIKRDGNLFNNLNISDDNLAAAGVSRTREDGTTKSNAELLLDIQAAIQTDKTPVPNQMRAAKAMLDVYRQNQRMVEELSKIENPTPEEQQQLNELKRVFNKESMNSLRENAIKYINTRLKKLSNTAEKIKNETAEQKDLNEIKEALSDPEFISTFTANLDTAENNQNLVKNGIAYASQIGLTDQQVSALRAVDAVLDSYKALRDNPDLQGRMDEVTDNIFSSDADANYDSGKLSIKQIMRDLYSFSDKSNFNQDESAKEQYRLSLERIENLYDLITSKLDALYQSRKTPNGARVGYDSFNPITGESYYVEDKDGIFYNNKSSESARMFRGMIQAQKDIRALYNNFTQGNAEAVATAYNSTTPALIEDSSLFENKYSDAQEVLNELDDVVKNGIKSQKSKQKTRIERADSRQRTNKQQANTSQNQRSNNISTPGSVLDKIKSLQGTKGNKFLVDKVFVLAVGNEQGPENLTGKSLENYNNALDFIKNHSGFTQQEKDLIKNFRRADVQALNPNTQKQETKSETKIEDRVSADESSVDSIAQATDEFVNRYLEGKPEVDVNKFNNIEREYKAQSKKLGNKPNLTLWNSISRYFRNIWFKDSPKDSIYKPGMSQVEVLQRAFTRINDKLDSYINNPAYPAEAKEKLTKFKDRLKYYLSTEDSKSPLVEAASTIARVFNEGFNSYQTKAIESGKASIADTFLGNRFAVGVFGDLNTDRNGNLRVSLNDAILGVAALTMLEITNELSNYMGNRDTSNIEQEYGINSGDINPKDLDILLSGSRADTIIAAINKRLIDNLGININNDVSMSFNGTKAISGLSLIIMQSLKELGVIDKHNISINVDGNSDNSRTYSVVTFNENRYGKSAEEISKVIADSIVSGEDVSSKLGEQTYYSKAKLSGLNKNAFLKAIAPLEDSREFFMDEPMPDVNTISKLNSPTSYTQAEKTAIENQRKTKYYLNAPFYNLVQKLGLSGLIDLFGNGTANKVHGLSNNEEVSDSESEFFNRNIYASVEGKNRTIFYGYAANMERARIAQELAGDKETPYIRIDYRMTRNGRYQETLPFGPGADKVSRQMFSHVREELDLNNDAENYVFSLALAQAFDIKVKDVSDRQAILDVASQIRQAIADNLDSARAAEGDLDLRDLQRVFTAIGNISVSYTDSQGRTRSISPKADITALALNGLLNAAKANASENGKFLNTLSLEIDATSAGISNLITMFDSNPDFTVSQLIGMWNGGHMVGNAISYPQYRDINHQDNYERAAELSSQNQEKLLREQVSDENKVGVNNLLRSILKVISLAGLNISYNDNYFSSGSNLDLKIPRSITKEIVTRMAYEQGLDSATTEFLVRIGDFIHQHMSYALQANTLLAKDNNPYNPFKSEEDRKKNLGALFFYNELENLDPESSEYAAKVTELNTKFSDLLANLDIINNFMLNNDRSGKIIIKGVNNGELNHFTKVLSDIKNYSSYNFVKDTHPGLKDKGTARRSFKDNFRELFMTSIFNAVNQIKGKGVLDTNASIIAMTNLMATAHEYEVVMKYNDFVKEHGYEPSLNQVREWNFGRDASLKLSFKYGNLTIVNVDKTRPLSLGSQGRRVRSMLDKDKSWNYQGSVFIVGPVNVSPVPVITHAITDGIIQTKSFDKIDNGSAVNRYDGTETSLKEASSNTQVANRAAHDITSINPLRPIYERFKSNEDKIISLLDDLQDRVRNLTDKDDDNVSNYLKSLQERVKEIYTRYNRNFNKSGTSANGIGTYGISGTSEGNTLNHSNMVKAVISKTAEDQVNNIDNKQKALRAAPTLTAHMVANNEGYSYGLEDTNKVTKYSPKDAPNNLNDIANHVVNTLNQEKNNPTAINTREQYEGVQTLSVEDVKTKFSPTGSQFDRFINTFVFNNIPSGYKIIVGTREQITAYARLNLKQDFPGSAQGACVPSAKTILLVNNSKTILAHELIHAVTQDKIVRFCNLTDEDIKKLNPEDAQAYRAFQGLNSLLNDFKEMREDIDNINTESDNFDMSSYREMKSSLQGLYNHIFGTLANDRPAQLYEFMAFAMTDPSIRNFLSNKNVSRTTDAHIREGVLQKALQQFIRMFNSVKHMATAFFRLDRNAFDSRVDADTMNFLTALEISTAVLTDSTLLQEDKVSGSNNSSNAMALAVQLDEDPRLARVMSNFKSAVDDAINSRLYEQFPKENQKSVKLLQKTFIADTSVNESRFNGLINEAVKAGFNMTAQQMQAAKMIMSMFNTGLGINPVLKVEAENLRKLIVDRLSSEDFLRTSTDSHQAQTKYDYLANTFGYTVRGINNAPSTLATYLRDNRDASLSIFMGLALTNPELRDIMEKITLNTSNYLDTSRVVNSANNKADEIINSLGSRVVDLITASITNRPKSATARAILDNYVDTIHHLNREFSILNLPNTIITSGDAVVKNSINKLLRKVIDSDTFQNQIDDPNNNRVKAILLSALSSGIDLWTADASVVTADIRRNINNFAIKHPGVIARFLTTSWKELFAPDTDYDKLQEIQKKNKAETQVKRQVYRETLPRIILEQFSNAGINLTKEDKQALNVIINKCDLGALSEQEIRTAFRTRDGIDNQINKLESDISTLVSSQDMLDKILKKSKQLANYMLTGTAEANLLRNPEAIARLLNVPHKGRVTDMNALVNTIDKLVTLYALSGSNQSQLNIAKNIFKQSDAAMLYTIAQQRNLRTNEINEALNSERGRFNYYKGYTPFSNKNGASVLIIDPSQLETYESMGYEKIGNYDGPRIENTPPLIYVSNNINPMMSFSQGALQTTVNLVGGVDPTTGVSSQLTAGRITNPYIIGQYRNRLNQDTGNENFMPVFDSRGNIIALERSVNPAYLNAIKQETNFAQVLGNWSGRQIEESMSEELNLELIQRLKDMYDNAFPRDRANYVDVVELARRDPIIRDSLNTLSAKTKQHIFDTFGSKFMVRQDMLDDVLGHRRASIVDSFTGRTRLSKTSQQIIRNAAQFLMGKKAFRNLYVGERVLMNVVAGARNWIVVRSLSVLLDNNLSNMIQLNMRGIGFMDMFREMPQLLKEIESYNLYRQQRAKLEADLNAAKGEGKLNQYKINAIENRLRALDESISQLSIKPLLDAGEYNTISDIGDTEDDLNLSMGRWGEWIEQKVDALPKGIRDAGKYALISKDTALYRALEKGVQYGDFIAKAIYYKHLINKGMPHNQALSKIRYEFVNYDMLPGRSREFLENIGLLWFYNYKLRTARVMFSMLKDNPLHALMFLGLPEITDGIGSPLTDNILSKVVGGGITGSIGYGLLLDTPSNLMWFNLIP